MPPAPKRPQLTPEERRRKLMRSLWLLLAGSMLTLSGTPFLLSPFPLFLLLFVLVFLGMGLTIMAIVRNAQGRGPWILYVAAGLSLLFAGIMLHDLAKVLELSGPNQTEYTVRGNLIGHIALIDSEITKTVMELGIDDTREEVVLLRHVILSHHGLLEYGSPVRPRIMEAEIIHMIDNLDASMMMMSTALALVDKGEMTNKIFAMDNRSFYKPDLD